MSHCSRVIEVSGVYNFRDYGHYALKTGGRLAGKTLYRSGDIAGVTDGGLGAVTALQLSSVVDLRGVAERQAAPSRFPTGFAASVFFSNAETAHQNAAPHREAAFGSMDAQSARKRMLAGYESMPFRPALVEMYSRHFRSLAESAGPSLVFCTAGKDRTGLAVALLHFAMGVHWDDLLGDYLLTNTTGDVEARVDAIRADLNERFAARLEEDAIRVVTSVEPQYLDRSFNVITNRFGTVDNYLREVLKVTNPMRGAIEKNLVA
jgi:protein-tyrosine phosphatase